MTEFNQPDPAAPQYAATPPPPPAYGAAPVAAGPVGKIRGTGVSILLLIVTLGIYSLVYYFKTHDELKRNTGQGLGGGVALLLGFFVAFVLAFTFPGEVGKARQSRGLEPKVSPVTGLWILLPILGGIIWFVKTNGALNEYWESQGATA